MTTKKTISKKIKEQTIKQIKELIKELKNNKVRNLTCGGCGHFAHIMYRALVKKHPSVKIVWFDNYLSNKERNRRIDLVMENDDFGYSKGKDLSCNHIMIELYGYHIDGEGVYLKNNHRWKYTSYRGKFTFTGLEIALRFGYWNPSYRITQNSVVKKVVKKVVEVEEIF